MEIEDCKLEKCAKRNFVVVSDEHGKQQNALLLLQFQSWWFYMGTHYWLHTKEGLYLMCPHNTGLKRTGELTESLYLWSRKE